MKLAALVLALLASGARAQLISGGSASGGSVTSPATGAGVDTCTGNGCAIGGAGMTVDGGVTVYFGNVTIPTVNKSFVADSVSPIIFNGATASSGIFYNLDALGTIEMRSLGSIPQHFFNDGHVVFDGSTKTTALIIGTTLALSSTAPTNPVACTSPTITHGRTASFQADVGSSCTGVSTFAFTVPATTNGMRCTGDNTTASATRVLGQSAGWTGTTVTMTNYSRTLGTAADFADGADLVIDCFGR